MPRRILSLFRNLLRKHTVEQALYDELRSSVEILAEEKMKDGLSRAVALRQAMIELGGVEQVKEEVRAIRVGRFLENCTRDLRLALRTLAKAPSFTAVVILTLALGIGANTTIFAMVSRFVLHTAPVGDPPTLLTLHTTDQNECCNNFSWPLFTDVRDGANSFAGVAGLYELLPASIPGSGDPQRLWGQATSTNFFDVAQLGMTLGRGFRSDEQNSPVIVLGHRIWKSRFNSDHDILGKSIALSGHPYTVVGVAPAYFRGIDLILDTQFWVPIGNIDQLLPNTGHFDWRNYHWIAVAARLKPGVSRAEAAAELQLLSQRFTHSHPDTEKNLGFRFEQAGSLPPRDKTVILLFLSTLTLVVFFVLLIACANVANLFLAQAAGRQREMAVRLFAFLLSLATGVLFGLLPAWTAAWRFLSTTLKGEDVLARPGRLWTLRNVLVVAQISMSLVLLCVTGLCLRSLRSASSINIGFRSSGVLAMSIDPRLHSYTPEHTVQFLAELQRRASAVPGVSSAAVTDALPLSGGHRSDGFQAVGKKPLDPTPSAELYMATPGYLDTLGIHLISGRDFSRESSTSPRVAIVNQVFADMFFPHENPIGESVSGGGVTYEIIGVTNNIKSRFLGEDLRPVLFRSLPQTVASDPSFEGYTILARTAADSPSVAASVRSIIRDMDPTLAVFNEQTMEHHVREALFLPRLAGTLFAVFGTVGLLLAAIGLYGIMNHTVSLRLREIGIRMALGAQTSSVERLFLRRGLQLTAAGLAIGLPAAFVIAKLFNSILYGIKPNDAITFISIPLFLAFVALLASYIPARRATKLDPMIALRYE